nr:hypothetical protein [Tanacetum cinerariifolium]
SVTTAQKLFALMEERHVTTWNAMIDGYGMEAIKLFSKIENKDINPNNVTFLALMWEIKSKMEERGIRKISGYSSIDLENEVYTFYSRSSWHYPYKEIYDFLETLIDNIKAVGYVLDNDLIHEDIYCLDADGALFDAALFAVAIAFSYCLNYDRDKKFSKLELAHRRCPFSKYPPMKVNPFPFFIIVVHACAKENAGEGNFLINRMNKDPLQLSTLLLHLLDIKGIFQQKNSSLGDYKLQFSLILMYMPSCVNMAHAVMADGGVIAHVGLNMVALASQRQVVPFVVLACIH